MKSVKYGLELIKNSNFLKNIFTDLEGDSLKIKMYMYIKVDKDLISLLQV